MSDKMLASVGPGICSQSKVGVVPVALLWVFAESKPLWLAGRAARLDDRVQDEPAARNGRFFFEHLHNKEHSESQGKPIWVPFAQACVYPAGGDTVIAGATPEPGKRISNDTNSGHVICTPHQFRGVSPCHSGHIQPVRLLQPGRIIAQC